MKPPLPGNEQRRLEVLWEYGMLDTPAEAEFDTLTQLAAQICQVPIALISLVDEHRQWFKARVGTSLTQTDREISFCAHAILTPELTVVRDATTDPRFAANPLVTGEPGIRFYAGMPLITSDGLALGTLCVLDHHPRDLLEDQKVALRLIAELVLRRLDAHRHLQQASHATRQTAQLARTTAELETEIQRRRRAEEEIRRYADIVLSIQVGILVWRLEDAQRPESLLLVAANPAATRTTGLPADTLIGRTLLEIFPRVAGLDLAHRLAEVTRTGTSADLGCFTYEDERIPKRDFSIRAFPLPGNCVGVALDNVTSQRLAEQAQIESQARKAAILDSAPDAIVTLDHEGRVYEWNLAAERMFGHRRAAVLGKPLATLVFSPASARRFQESIDLCVRTGDGAMLGRRTELVGRRSDATEFPVELSLTRVHRQGAPIFTGFLHDLTERKRFEDTLRHAQKMETVGQLAGGVAHDFNNLLTVIQGHASILLANKSANTPEVLSLQQIANSAERAAHLTRQLLAFSRKQVLQPVRLDVNQLIHRLSARIRRSVGEKVELRLDTQAEPSLILADPVMLEQVLLNLAVNSRDAMPDGGQFRIRTAQVNIDTATAVLTPDASPGRYIQIIVSDTGTGIPSPHLARVFEPFFTTKEVGKGSGLGLATVYGIVKQHHGWISVSSELDHGTTFQIHLPTALDQRVALPTSPAATPAPRGQPTVLVVEDEPALRALVLDLLSHDGYRVLEACSGPVALDLWQQHRSEIDLLFTDIAMPEGINGRELATRLLADKPTLQVLYTSGYSAEIVGDNFVLEEGVNFLQKPYNPSQLTEAIRASLARA
jgi:PAS domain S-box-containing protein